MANIVANVNQVLYNSPQVTSLVGGQAAAEEEALRQGRTAEVRRQEEALAKMVLAMEKGAAIEDEVTAEDGRRETRRERLARLKAERELRLRAARAARAERMAKEAGRKKGRQSSCAEDLSDQDSVINVCI